MAKPPAEIGRNKFDEWCWKRGLDLTGTVEALRQAAITLGLDPKLAPSRETVRLIRLPFSDPRRRVPGEQLMPLIYAATAGEIIPADFYPAHLRGSAALGGHHGGAHHGEAVTPARAAAR